MVAVGAMEETSIAKDLLDETEENIVEKRQNSFVLVFLPVTKYQKQTKHVISCFVWKILE